ncbi:hypothetical protein FQR65_LT13914 [Abscondita terminalis]|nr:hypothetical protein FQR65_LT13914 [Abscondita terminalis]
MIAEIVWGFAKQFGEKYDCRNSMGVCKTIWRKRWIGPKQAQAHDKHERYLKKLAQRRNMIAEIVWGFAKQFGEKYDCRNSMGVCKTIWRKRWIGPKQAQAHDKHERRWIGPKQAQAHDKHERYLKKLEQRRNMIAEIVWGFAKQFGEKDELDQSKRKRTINMKGI